MEMHHGKPFVPTELGHYIVTLNDRHYGSSPDPYTFELHKSQLDNGRVVVTVADLNSGLCYINGDLSTLRKFSDIKTDFWIGPIKYARKCFKCERLLVSVPRDDDQEQPQHKYVMFPDDGPSFESTGHYGCTTIDDLGHRTFHIVICDACIVKNSDKVLVWETQTFKSMQTGKFLRKTDYGHAYLNEDDETIEKWKVAEIEFFEKRGYEWRNYDREHKRSTPEDADYNNSGWFKKRWKDPRPGTASARLSNHAWMKDKKTVQEHEALRHTIFGFKASGYAQNMVVDETTGEEMPEMESWNRANPGWINDVLKDAKKRARNEKRKKKREESKNEKRSEDDSHPQK